MLQHNDYLLWRLRDKPGQSTLGAFEAQPVSRTSVLNPDTLEGTVHQPAHMPMSASKGPRPESILAQSAPKRPSFDGEKFIDSPHHKVEKGADTETDFRKISQNAQVGEDFMNRLIQQNATESSTDEVIHQKMPPSSSDLFHSEAKSPEELKANVMVQTAVDKRDKINNLGQDQQGFGWQSSLEDGGHKQSKYGRDHTSVRQPEQNIENPEDTMAQEGPLYQSYQYTWKF